MKSSIHSFFCILCLVSCSSKVESNYDKPIQVDQAKVKSIIQNGTAAKLIKDNCFTCHNPAATSHDDMLAPPLVGMKYKYQQAFPKKEDFIYNMANFIANPSKDNAIMRGPVRRFGVMPKSVLQPEEIQAVVTYLYDNKVEQPDWFSKHFEEEHGKKWEDQQHSN